MPCVLLGGHKFTDPALGRRRRFHVRANCIQETLNSCVDGARAFFLLGVFIQKKLTSRRGWSMRLSSRANFIQENTQFTDRPLSPTAVAHRRVTDTSPSGRTAPARPVSRAALLSYAKMNLQVHFPASKVASQISHATFEAISFATQRPRRVDRPGRWAQDCGRLPIPSSRRPAP